MQSETERAAVAALEEARRLTDQARVAKGLAPIDQPNRPRVKAQNVTSSDGLFAAIKEAGYDRVSNPAVLVDFKAATFTGSVEDFGPATRPSAALGYDQRFLFPSLPVDATVPPDATSVTSFRQSARTLAATGDMIRTIAATTAKPVTSTELEATSVALKQVATINSGIPNVFLANEALRGFVNADLRLAYSRAVDAHILATIAATTPASGAYNAQLIVAILLAAEVVQAAGYSPNTVVLSPAQWHALRVAVQPGSGDWVAGATDFMLDGLTKVSVAGLTAPVVLDSKALGVFHTTGARFATFEEADGSTNTSTVRLESNSVFAVQREDAVAAIDVTP